MGRFARAGSTCLWLWITGIRPKPCLTVSSGGQSLVAGVSRHSDVAPSGQRRERSDAAEARMASPAGFRFFPNRGSFRLSLNNRN
jgi:hypothetical protein